MLNLMSAGGNKIKDGFQNLTINLLKYKDLQGLINVDYPKLSEDDQMKVMRIITGKVMDDDDAQHVRDMINGVADADMVPDN